MGELFAECGTCGATFSGSNASYEASVCGVTHPTIEKPKPARASNGGGNGRKRTTAKRTTAKRGKSA